MPSECLRGGVGIFVSEMKKKKEGLWEEEGKSEVYSANLFYNNTSEIAKVRGRTRDKAGRARAPHLHNIIDSWGRILIPSPFSFHD